ncbi:VTT domain-containing protein [uncultured Sulfitobacter sp.]|uniref:VTT domain-containing protein n=1 Tax=uncultured Sulfitobacter sp. TaxID=191468 RepID=UPI00261990A6|nr:VTT domain-containing protein [uncultured Sulfitobacter sp.]
MTVPETEFLILASVIFLGTTIASFTNYFLGRMIATRTNWTHSSMERLKRQLDGTLSLFAVCALAKFVPFTRPLFGAIVGLLQVPLQRLLFAELTASLFWSIYLAAFFELLPNFLTAFGVI